MRRSRLRKSSGVLAGSWNQLKIENDSLPEALARHEIEHKLIGRK